MDYPTDKFIKIVNLMSDNMTYLEIMSALEPIIPTLTAEEKKVLLEIEVPNILNYISLNDIKLDADDFDKTIHAKSVLIVLRNTLKGHIPSYIGFKGSQRQDSPPLEAYNYKSFNIM